MSSTAITKSSNSQKNPQIQLYQQNNLFFPFSPTKFLVGHKMVEIQCAEWRQNYRNKFSSPIPFFLVML